MRDGMTPHPQGNGKPGEVPESEPVAWMTMAPQTAPLVSAAFLRERPEFRNIYTIPLYTTPQPAIPPGFKVVPVEPTRAMLQAVHDGPYGADEHDMDSDNEEYLRDCYRAAVKAAPGVSESCPNAAHMGEHACKNKAQCWEPCGELGNDERYVRVASAADTAAINAALSPAPAQAQAPVEVSDNKGALK